MSFIPNANELSPYSCLFAVAFRIYDIDQDGFISNGELFQVLKTMVGSNLTEKQLQEIVDKTIYYADKDGDGKISFEEFSDVSLFGQQVQDLYLGLHKFAGHSPTEASLVFHFRS